MAYTNLTLMPCSAGIRVENDHVTYNISLLDVVADWYEIRINVVHGLADIVLYSFLIIVLWAIFWKH